MKNPPVAAHGRHRVGRARVLALERDASKQEDATVAEILPVARCSDHRFKFWRDLIRFLLASLAKS